MDSACPDNSTDCLLRAILDANSGYNWNPATFAFTVVFTVIALIVSIVALLQSLVAAGPGRLKASEKAIGIKQHRQRAVTRFSWEEFRFRTIVNVPVIEVSKVLTHTPTTIVIDDKGYDEKTNPPISSRVVAGWSQLLNELSLTDVKFSTSECLTDYMPDDVLAAPAFARVESILILSIMKGCNRLTKDQDGFINLVGRSAQLSWNMHPILGATAIYHAWDIRDIPRHTLVDVQKMIPVFLGELYLSNVKLYKPLPPRRNDIPVSFDANQLKTYCAQSWANCRHHHKHCYERKESMWVTYLMRQNKHGVLDKKTAALASTLFADRPTIAKAFPTKITEIHPTLVKILDEHFPWLILADNLDEHVLRTLCGSSFIDIDEWDLDIDRVGVDKYQTNSWLLGASNESAEKPDNSFNLQRPTISRSDSAIKPNMRKITYAKSSYEKMQSSNLRVCRPAIRHLTRWLADDTYFETTNITEVIEMRKWIAYQLSELDWFLSTMGDDVICAACNIVAMSLKGAIRFMRIGKRHVLPQTLDAFGLSWMNDPEDEGSVIIKDYLDDATLVKLFAYTKHYIEQHRSELYTVDCPGSKQGFYYDTKKQYQTAEHSEEQYDKKPDAFGASEEPKIESSNSSATDRTTDRDKRESSGTQDDSEQNHKDTLHDPDKGVQVQITQMPLKPAGESEVREWVDEESRRKAENEGEDAIEEVPEIVDEKIAALEALMFYRAAILGALLATGTDTSMILTLENRFQLVQVQ